MPLARLFALSYRWMTDELHRRLTADGWTGIRPAYGFVLLALRDDALTTTRLAATLDVTKQAASKLADAMIAAGLVNRQPDPTDGRQSQLLLSPGGRRLLDDVETIYVQLEHEWAEAIGATSLRNVRSALTDALTALHQGTLPPIRPLDQPTPNPKARPA